MYNRWFDEETCPGSRHKSSPQCAEHPEQIGGCTSPAYTKSSPEQVARRWETTESRIKRYREHFYKEALQREAGRLVKLKIEPRKSEMSVGTTYI